MRSRKLFFLIETTQSGVALRRVNYVLLSQTIIELVSVELAASRKKSARSPLLDPQVSTSPIELERLYFVDNRVCDPSCVVKLMSLAHQPNSPTLFIAQIDPGWSPRGGISVPPSGITAAIRHLPARCPSVIDCYAQFLFAPEVTLCCLDRDVSEQELNLIEFAAGEVTEPAIASAAGQRVTSYTDAVGCAVRREGTVRALVH